MKSKRWSFVAMMSVSLSGFDQGDKDLFQLSEIWTTDTMRFIITVR